MSLLQRLLLRINLQPSELRRLALDYTATACLIGQAVFVFTLADNYLFKTINVVGPSMLPTISERG